MGWVGGGCPHLVRSRPSARDIGWTWQVGAGRRGGCSALGRGRAQARGGGASQRAGLCGLAAGDGAVQGSCVPVSRGSRRSQILAVWKCALISVVSMRMPPVRRVCNAACVSRQLWMCVATPLAVA
jgi:hypothetical protein